MTLSEYTHRTPRDTLLCVDFSYQVYRATCAHPMLSSGGTFTGGLYGFFMFLGKAVRDTRATRLAITLDSRPYLRSQEYPDYKKLRKKTLDPEVKERYEVSKRLVLETLFTVGAPCYALQGFESDDLIAGIALRNRHRFERIYAGSNDSDLWQLLWMDNFIIYRTGMDDLVTGDWLMKKHGLLPEQHMLATALTGSHNDVEGIRGVGDVTAYRAVKEPALMRQMRAKHGDLIDRNLALIKLPHRMLPPDCTLLDAPARRFDPRSLYKALGRYDVDVTDWMVKAFEVTSV